MKKLIPGIGALCLLALVFVMSGCEGSTASQGGIGTAAKNSSPELQLSPPPVASQPAPTDNVPRIDGPEAVRLVRANEAILVDTRDAESFKNGHCKSAINIPYADFGAGNFHNLPKDKKLIFYCT